MLYDCSTLLGHVCFMNIFLFMIFVYFHHESCLRTFDKISIFFYFFLFLMKGDVYPVEPFDDFPVNQVLDAHWGVLYDEDVRYFLYL